MVFVDWIGLLEVLLPLKVARHSRFDTMTLFQCQCEQTKCKLSYISVKLCGLPSVQCTPSHCFTQMEWETLPEFVVANMLISVSSIDSTHPPTWQRVTPRKCGAASPLTELWMLCCLFVCACVCICLYLCVCVLMSICVRVCIQCLYICRHERKREWLGRWCQDEIMVAACHTYTSPSLRGSVRLSHQCVEECGSQWDLCRRTGLDITVLSTLFQVRCVHDAVSGAGPYWHGSPAVTAVLLSRRCLHLLLATLSHWTQEVWGARMPMSHEKNANIVWTALPFSWDIKWRWDKHITVGQRQGLWSDNGIW